MNDNEMRQGLPRQLLMLAGAMVLAMLGLSLWAWLQLPADARIPVHFAADGSVNRYGGKVEGLLAVPLITLGLVVLFALLPYLEPRHRHMAQSRIAFGWVVGSVVLFLAAVHLLLVLKAFGHAIEVDRFVVAGIGLLLAVIGNFLGKVRSNFFLGIRTPWSLSSELSWSKTHRLGGKLFVVAGLGMVLSALSLPTEALTPVVLALILTAVLVPVFYSWWVWRGDRQQD